MSPAGAVGQSGVTYYQAAQAICTATVAKSNDPQAAKSGKHFGGSRCSRQATALICWPGRPIFDLAICWLRCDCLSISLFVFAGNGLLCYNQ